MFLRVLFSAMLPVFFVLSPAIAEDYFAKTTTAPTLAAGEDEAMVYVLRIAQAGMAIKFWAFADDQLLGITKGKTCTAALVPAGAHTFWSRGENVSAFDLEVTAGNTYYFQQKVRIGGMKARVKFEALTEAEGMAALAKCKNYSTPTEEGARRGAEIAEEKLSVAREKAKERED